MGNALHEVCQPIDPNASSEHARRPSDSHEGRRMAVLGEPPKTPAPRQSIRYGLKGSEAAMATRTWRLTALSDQQDTFVSQWVRLEQST